MPDKPPDELDALKAALRVEREARQQAEARASSAEAMVAYYKLRMAKLRHEHYGQSSERGCKLLDRWNCNSSCCDDRVCVFRTKSATDSGMKSATDSDLISAIPI